MLSPRPCRRAGGGCPRSRPGPGRSPSTGPASTIGNMSRPAAVTPDRPGKQPQPFLDVEQHVAGDRRNGAVAAAVEQPHIGPIPDRTALLRRSAAGGGSSSPRPSRTRAPSPSRKRSRSSCLRKVRASSRTVSRAGIRPGVVEIGRAAGDAEKILPRLKVSSRPRRSRPSAR